MLSLVCKTFHHIVADIKNIDKTYYKFLIKIFREMLLVDQHSHSQLTNTVKFFLTNFAVPFFNNGDYTNIGYLIEDFDKIVKFLGDAKKHSHSLIVNVFKLIVHASFEMENKESPSVTSDSFKNNQHFRDTISSANSNTNVGVSTPNFRTSFLKNLDKILPSIDLETQNKFLMHHFFSHFETEEDKFTFGYKIFFFKNLLSIEEKLNNVEFFLCFYSFIGRFQDYILDTNLDWRIGVGYIKSLKKYIQFNT